MDKGQKLIVLDRKDRVIEIDGKILKFYKDLVDYGSDKPTRMMTLEFLLDLCEI